MLAFVKMREVLTTNKEFAEKLKRIEEHLAGHDDQLRVVFEAIKQLIKEDERSQKRIGF
jgi:hypothetical protein